MHIEAIKRDIWAWTVESESSREIYNVLRDNGKFTCDCPQFVYRKIQCKHIIKCKASKQEHLADIEHYFAHLM